MIGHLDGILDNSEGPQPQKVHLEKAQFLNGGHGELRRSGTVLGARKRDQILCRLRTDHDARRVDGSVPGQALQTQAHVDQLADPVIILIGIAKIRALFERLLQSDAQLLGDHLGDGIHISVGQVHDTSHIADHPAGCHCPEGDDLHHAVPAVFFRDIIDDLTPALEAEIHVDIGHGHALGVEETLKQEVIADGVNICDPQRIGDNRARRTSAPGADHDPVLTGKIDIVPDNEKIVDISHLTDRAQPHIPVLPAGPQQ